MDLEIKEEKPEIVLSNFQNSILLFQTYTRVGSNQFNTIQVYLKKIYITN